MTDGDDLSQDNVVRDPVSGRPLHEFVVDPLAAPTGLPTEGAPTDEPGVQQAPHGDTRKDPVLVFTVSRDLDIDQAVEAMTEVIKDARRKLAERREG